MSIETTNVATASLSFDYSPSVLGRATGLYTDRRTLHQIPEPGFAEHKTAAFVANRLANLGIAHETGIAETGIVASIDSGRPGPTLAFRADMDGLPIVEETGLPFSSTHDGMMHACGHDGHTAILLSLLEILVKEKSNWSGKVIGIFQPAEEHPGGAQPMVDAGVLDRYKPDRIYGVHLWTFLPFPQVAIQGGPIMASADTFTITLRGTGGHAALPHLANDLVVAASQLVVNLQTAVSRSISPLDPGVITVGKLHAGTAHNVLPEVALLEGTVRALSNDARSILETRVREITRGITETYNIAADVDFQRGYPVNINDYDAAIDLLKAAKGIVAPEHVVADGRTLAAEDMGVWLREIPGCYFFVGASNSAKGITEPHHSPRFTIDEESMLLALEIMYRGAIDYLKEPGA